MPKHLLLGGDTSTNWRLPADTDVAQLRAQLLDAMDQGKTLTVQVEMKDNPLTTTQMLISGRNLVAAAVVELPEPDQT